MTWKSSITALQHRNYRLLWIGLLISMSGSTMRNAAILWHVSILVPESQRALALGIVGLVRVIPVIVFGFAAGVVADAMDRRRLLLFVNSVLLCSSTTLAIVTLTGRASVAIVYLFAAVTAAIGAFEPPARQSLFPSLVPREHLANAISLNGTMFHTASVVGPMVGGLIIAAGGVGWAYVFDAGSFAALIVSVLLMRDIPSFSHENRAPLGLGSLKEGLRFVFKQPLIRSSMLMDFVATFFASATALLPIFAQDILKVGARGYGVLVSAPAVGAVVASLGLVRFVDAMTRRGLILIVSVVIYGLATLGFGLSTHFGLSFAFLFLSGSADTVSSVLRNIIRQLVTPDHMRGRMTSVSMVFFMGGPQLGELEAGLVAQWFGAVFSVVSGGVACVAATLWIARRTPELVAYRK